MSAYWNGAATYYRGIIRALHGRGHRVTFYEPDALERQAHRDMADPTWARVVVYQPQDVYAALGSTRDADVIVKASGVGVQDELLERAVLSLRRPGQAVVFWDVDAPATLERVASNPDDPFRALIPQYDLIFTYGGGDPVVWEYGSLGARACIPIYNALDPLTHHPVRPDSRFAGLLAFWATGCRTVRRASESSFSSPRGRGRTRDMCWVGMAGTSSAARPPTCGVSDTCRVTIITPSTARRRQSSTSTARAWRGPDSRRQPGCSRRPVLAPVSSSMRGRGSRCFSSPVRKCW